MNNYTIEEIREYLKHYMKFECPSNDKEAMNFFIHRRLDSQNHGIHSFVKAKREYESKRKSLNDAISLLEQLKKIVDAYDKFSIILEVKPNLLWHMILEKNRFVIARFNHESNMFYAVNYDSFTDEFLGDVGLVIKRLNQIIYEKENQKENLFHNPGTICKKDLWVL